jgi:mannosyltransferase
MEEDRCSIQRPPLARSFWAVGLLIGILLLAFGLRLYHIDAQSLWNDEGTSVALAGRGLAAITQGAANDIHPPLYYYLLHFWMAWFGKSELAVRSLSALLGTLVVLLAFALGCLWRDHGYRTGLLAALFAALSPFQVYYSQEARMYILTAFLGAVSVYAFLQLLLSGWQKARSHSRWPYWAALYILSTILLLYSHYFAATVIIVENLAFLWWLVAGRQWQQDHGIRRWSPLWRWVALQAVVGASYVPWLLLTREQLRVWPAISEPFGLTTLLSDLVRVFSLGLSVPAGSGPLLVGFALLGLSGMLMTLRDARRTGDWVPCVPYVLYLFVPIGVMYVLSLQRPMYNPKFLLLCNVPFCLFLAQGVLYPGSGLKSWLDRVLVLAAIAFVVLSSVYSLHAYYFNPRYARDNYRGIAQYIQAVEGEGDAVLINAPGQIDTFTYYYRGELSLYPLPGQRPLDEAQTEVDLEQMVQGRKRLFAVLWATDESDPGRFIEGWLDQQLYKALDSWYGNVRLVVYAVPEESALGRIDHPLNVGLGDTVRLLGYNRPSAAGETWEVMPGDILQLTLVWQAVAPMTERYKVFTHVLDPYGHLVGQRDAEPGGGARITTTWKEGEQVVDNYGLPILPGTPPGDYVIEIGMYGLSDGQRLPITKDGEPAGDFLVLQSVRVLSALAPPPLSVLGMRKELNVRFESRGERGMEYLNVTLLGYDLAKLGQEHEPDAPVHPGDILHLTLFWQAQQAPAEDLAVLLRLQDAAGKVWLERRTQPTEGMYPAAQWRVNEIIRDQHNLFLPPDLPFGRSYRITLSIERLSSGTPVGSAITLSSLAVQPR